MSVLTNPALQGRIRKLDKERQDVQREHLRSVMSTPAGRATFYWLIFDVCGVMSGSYAGSSSQTDFNEGGRSVGVKLVEQLQQVAGNDYVLMVQEQLAQRESERKAAEAIATEAAKGDDDA